MAAFDALYDRYETRLFSYLRAVTGDARDAEEVLHDAFLATLKSGELDVAREGAFRAWLYKVARNMALNRRRSGERRERTIQSAAVGGESNALESPHRLLEEKRIEQALALAVSRLPAALGELYELRASGLSQEEIAGVFEVPLGTVKSRMHQMVQVLKKELDPWIAAK